MRPAQVRRPRAVVAAPRAPRPAPAQPRPAGAAPVGGFPGGQARPLSVAALPADKRYVIVVDGSLRAQPKSYLLAAEGGGLAGPTRDTAAIVEVDASLSVEQLAALQGRVGAGACVKSVAVGLPPAPDWVEVWGDFVALAVGGVDHTLAAGLLPGHMQSRVGAGSYAYDGVAVRVVNPFNAYGALYAVGTPADAAGAAGPRAVYDVGGGGPWLDGAMLNEGRLGPATYDVSGYAAAAPALAPPVIPDVPRERFDVKVRAVQEFDGVQPYRGVVRIDREFAELCARKSVMIPYGDASARTYVQNIVANTFQEDARWEATIPPLPVVDATGAVVDGEPCDVSLYIVAVILHVLSARARAREALVSGTADANDSVSAADVKARQAAYKRWRRAWTTGNPFERARLMLQMPDLSQWLPMIPTFASSVTHRRLRRDALVAVIALMAVIVCATALEERLLWLVPHGPYFAFYALAHVGVGLVEWALARNVSLLIAHVGFAALAVATDRSAATTAHVIANVVFLLRVLWSAWSFRYSQSAGMYDRVRDEDDVEAAADPYHQPHFGAPASLFAWIWACFADVRYDSGEGDVWVDHYNSTGELAHIDEGVRHMSLTCLRPSGHVPVPDRATPVVRIVESTRPLVGSADMRALADKRNWLRAVGVVFSANPAVLRATHELEALYFRYNRAPVFSDGMRPEELNDYALVLADVVQWPGHGGLLRTLDEELAEPGAFTTAQRIKFDVAAWRVRPESARVVFFPKREHVRPGARKWVDGRFVMRSKARLIGDCGPELHGAQIPGVKVLARWMLDWPADHQWRVGAYDDPPAHAIRFERARQGRMWALEQDGSQYDAYGTELWRAVFRHVCARLGIDVPMPVIDVIRTTEGHSLRRYDGLVSGTSATTVFNSITNLVLYTWCLEHAAPDAARSAQVNAVGDDSYIALQRALTHDEVARFDTEAARLGHPMAAGGGVRFIGSVGYCSNVPWPCRPYFLRGVLVGHVWAGKVAQSLSQLTGAFSEYTVAEAAWIVADNARNLLVNNDHVPIVRTVAAHVARLARAYSQPSRRWIAAYRARQYAWAHFDEHAFDERPTRVAPLDDRTEHLMFALYGHPPGYETWMEYEVALDEALRDAVHMPFVYTDPVLAAIFAIEGDGPRNPLHVWNMDF